MVQEIRSLQKLAIFFRVSRWGRRGGACTRYFTVYTVSDTHIHTHTQSHTHIHTHTHTHTCTHTHMHTHTHAQHACFSCCYIHVYDVTDYAAGHSYGHVHVAHLGRYATKFTQYTHQNTCVSEDESMKGIRSSIPAWIIVPN